jgi:hypothetical protein
MHTLLHGIIIKSEHYIQLEFISRISHRSDRNGPVVNSALHGHDPVCWFCYPCFIKFTQAYQHPTYFIFVTYTKIITHESVLLSDGPIVDHNRRSVGKNIKTNDRLRN